MVTRKFLVFLFILAVPAMLLGQFNFGAKNIVEEVYDHWTGYVNSDRGSEVREVPWGKILDNLASGEAVEVISDEGKWYRIKFRESEAFVLSQYISRSKNQKQGQESNDSGSQNMGKAYVNAQNGLIIRNSPWGGILGKLQNFTQVNILGKIGDWVKICYNGSTAFVHSDSLKKDKPAEEGKPDAEKEPLNKTSEGDFSVSDLGKQQMSNIVNYAKSHHTGASSGNCFNSVWKYMTASGYGKIKSWGDLPRMQSGEARHLSEYLNASPAHLDEAGLQRLDTSLTPPITNPHDSRIPAGAVIVVSAGSYGTSHRTAGDVVVKAGSNQFINDGPRMDYGTSSTWYGKVLGVYIPR